MVPFCRMTHIFSPEYQTKYQTNVCTKAHVLCSCLLCFSLPVLFCSVRLIKGTSARDCPLTSGLNRPLEQIVSYFTLAKDFLTSVALFLSPFILHSFNFLLFFLLLSRCHPLNSHCTLHISSLCFTVVLQWHLCFISSCCVFFFFFLLEMNGWCRGLHFRFKPPAQRGSGRPRHQQSTILIGNRL